MIFNYITVSVNPKVTKCTMLFTIIYLEFYKKNIKKVPVFRYLYSTVFTSLLWGEGILVLHRIFLCLDVFKAIIS